MGSVSYSYNISQFEVTNTQYTGFLNAADPTGANTRHLYNSYMGDYHGNIAFTGGIDYAPGAPVGAKYSVKSGQALKPVIWVDWYDAARFANWLNNGQGNGSTEAGAYDMTQTYPTRSAGATFFLPTEHEWYKSAYYQPQAAGGDTDNYWFYPTRSNTAPYSDNPSSLEFPGNSADYYNDDGNNANGYNDGFALSGSTTFNPAGNLTDVGAYGDTRSYYGLCDLAGNVGEWNETWITNGNLKYSGIRGGGWDSVAFEFQSSYRYPALQPTDETFNIGFRVANLPEPHCTLILIVPCVLASRRRG